MRQIEAGPAEIRPDPLSWLDVLLESPSQEALLAHLREHHPCFSPHLPRRMALVGAGEEGQRIYRACRKLGIEIVGCADDDPERQKQGLCSLRVVPVRCLAELDLSVPVVIASHRVLQVFDRLQSMGFNHIAPAALLQILYPKIFTPQVFYDGLLDDLFEHREQYRGLAAQLAEDKSRAVLDAVLGYRLTLIPAGLRPLVEWDLYNPACLLRYTDDEVYIDGGAYDGDTIGLFITRVKGIFRQVLAFEPDLSNFERLRRNFGHDSRVLLINKGLYSGTTTLLFRNTGTRASVLSHQRGLGVPVTSIDEALDGGRVTFIKMNIEGAEIEALRGAVKSIRRHRPKLAISVYHRPCHLWRIPRLISEICSGYKYLLRQHDGGIIETVLYALP